MFGGLLVVADLGWPWLWWLSSAPHGLGTFIRLACASMVVAQFQKRERGRIQGLLRPWHVILPPHSSGQHNSCTQPSFQRPGKSTPDESSYKITLERSWLEVGIENWGHFCKQSTIPPFIFFCLNWPDFCSWADCFIGSQVRQEPWISATGVDWKVSLRPPPQLRETPDTDSLKKEVYCL